MRTPAYCDPRRRSRATRSRSSANWGVEGAASSSAGLRLSHRSCNCRTTRSCFPCVTHLLGLAKVSTPARRLRSLLGRRRFLEIPPRLRLGDPTGFSPETRDRPPRLGPLRRALPFPQGERSLGPPAPVHAIAHSGWPRKGRLSAPNVRQPFRAAPAHWATATSAEKSGSSGR